jgi:hypothetical protein
MMRAISQLFCRQRNIIPSFLNYASLPLAQPFTDHTEQALCSAKKGQSRELGIIYFKLYIFIDANQCELRTFWTKHITPT